MSELALYRKYRSQTFDAVVGQNHIVTTLMNALKNQRISHAYLFTGPRGVGKTSMARLLARAVNCQSNSSQNTPCNSCDICLIPLASNMDIIEIDAASNRKIDEIRDLRDKINLAPARSRYKVYIIDEVHMLTTEAFNALLKTLEEPPAHAIFILATTEVHKLPDTIISRTQRFNFKAISLTDVEQQLSKIASAEGIPIRADALTMVAEAGAGSFRDAISLLDQAAMSGQGSEITAENIGIMLGLGNDIAVKEIVDAISQSQPVAAIKILDQLTAQGVQTNQLVMQLINHCRKLLRAKISSAKTDDLESALPEQRLATIITQLSQVLHSALPEIALETSLVELSTTHTALQPKTAPAPVTAPASTLSSSRTNPSVVEPNSKDLWPKALALIKAKNNSLYALLCSCRTEIGQNEVIIKCRFNFHRERLQESKNREIIETALNKVYGKTMHVRSQLENSGAQTSKPIDPEAELVSSALEILGGEVVDE